MEPSAPSSAIRFASALSTDPADEQAVAQVCGEALGQLGARPDLAVLFVSAERGERCARISANVCDALGSDCLLGCTGESIVGRAREVEHDPALSLWLAAWPDVHLTTMRLEFQQTPDGGTIAGWPEELSVEWPPGTCMIVLGDPFSFPADLLLQRMNEDRPAVPVVGGMASGGAEPGRNRLILGRQTYSEGAVAALLQGPVTLRTVVSQGCRPIGRPFVITRAERNVIYELGGRPALLQLKEIFDQLSNHEQYAVQHALHVGRVISEYQDQFGQGDFLVRNVTSVDPQSGAVAVAEYIRVGQTVQFHIRDAETADAELNQLLARVKQQPGAAPAAALLFTCNGRGTRLFHQPHHDAAAVDGAFGDIPLAGLFAQGEIGPVGGQNFLHGFTASVALFEPAQTAP